MRKILPLFLLFTCINAMAQNTFPASGNVGIGTMSPRVTLDLSNTGTIMLKEIHFVSDDLGYNYGGDNSDPYTLRKIHDALDVSHLDLNLNDNADESFRIYGNSCLGYGCGLYSGNLYHSFDASGNVYHAGNMGIGTTTPTERLTVNGNIKTKKLIVTQAGWSDYVFNDNYQLLPLSKLEQFIKANRHLPDMPSTLQVEKDGIDVGENQALLLKKIEEFTLYMIEQNRKLEELRKDNEQIKKEVAKLKKQNKLLILKAKLP